MIIVKKPKGNLTLQQKFTYWKKSTLVLSCLLLGCSLTACGDSTNAGSSNTKENTAPIANAGSDQAVFINSTVILSGEQSSDADEDDLSYAWTLSTLPSGSNATLSSESKISPSFTADVIGRYIVHLTVNDNEYTDDSFFFEK